jgi:hypothetical protein
MRGEKNEAAVLSRNLVTACERSKARSDAVIEALSVVLGMVIAHVAENRAVAHEIADTAMEAIRNVIAIHAKHDRTSRPDVRQ